MIFSVENTSILLLLLFDIASSSSFSSPKLFLSFGSDSIDSSNANCLVRENGFFLQPVHIVPCAQIPATNLLSAAWIFYKDGRIRGVNSLCLKYRADGGIDPNLGTDLVATECAHRSNSTDEIWSIKAGKLWSESLPELNDSKDVPIWRREPVQFSAFNETKMIAQQKKLLENAVDATRQRFRQMSRDIPDINRGLAEMLTILEQTGKESEEVDMVMKNVTQLIQEIKADLMGHPTHIGQGVVVEVLESSTSAPSASFISPKFELSSDQLRTAGINPSGPVTVRYAPNNWTARLPYLNPFVRVGGYAISPKAGSYRFVVKDLTSQFRLTVNGNTSINQWAAPTMGSITSSPMTLTEGDELQLTATTSGFLGVPNFKLFWKTSEDGIEEEIPTENLYPSIVEPLCSSEAFLIKIGCATTFNKIKFGSAPTRISCPAGCLSEKPIPKAFGTPTCYALHSSVCIAAIHSGVSGERGGSFLIQINSDEDKASYPSVEGFQFASSDAPAGKGCASITSSIPGMARAGLQNLKVFDRTDLLSSDGTGPQSGMYAILTSSDKTLVARRKWGPGFLKQIVISCGSSGYEFDSNAFDEQLQLIDGSKILIKNSASINDLTINDVFIAIDQSSFPLLLPTKDGWNRVNCQTTNHKISLYFKYSSLIDEYEFPSSTITCEDSFKSLNSPLHSFSVRCPRYCFKSFAPVMGLFSYSADSSVCRSAIHAGVIADGGGNVQVTRLPLVGPVKWSSKRNQIVSATDDSTNELFAVDVPSGRKCIYPEHPGGLSHVSASSPRFESASSFLQLMRSDHPIHRHSNEEESAGKTGSFIQMRRTESSFDISRFEKGGEAALTDMKAEFENLGQQENGKEKDLENARLAVSIVESLIREKLKQEEGKIHSLETELVELETGSAEPFIDYDRTTNIFEDWLVIDGGDSSLGPSSWAIEQSQGSTRLGIVQKSSIASKAALGTALVLKARSFDKGFLTGRIKITEGGYGTFGFIVKYLDDRNYVVLELSIPSNGGLGSVAFRRVNQGVWNLSEGQVSFDIPSGWINVGVDFGRQNIRAFINGDTLRTGLELDTPITGGTIGLMTNALGTDTVVIFDSIVVGPLESQEILAKEFFGTEAERKGPIHVELAGVKEAERVTAIEGVSLSPTRIPEIEKGNATLEVIEGVNMTLGVDKECLKNYEDSLGTGLDGWIVPTGAATWTLSTGGGERFIVGSENAKSQSVLYLARKTCQEGTGVRLSVVLRPQKDVRSGLIFRAASSARYFSVLLDFTDRGPQVLLSDVRDKDAKEFATVSSGFQETRDGCNPCCLLQGTGVKLFPDTWHELVVDDYGDILKVHLDGVVILQTKVPVMAVAGSQGLIVERGRSDFRNYKMSILD